MSSRLQSIDIEFRQFDCVRLFSVLFSLRSINSSPPLTNSPVARTLTGVQSYVEALEYLSALIDYETNPAQRATAQYLNLSRMRELLAFAGNPEQRVPAVHIAGTKGKGSTAAMIAQILRASGLRVGLYTSPHLVNFRERIRINGEMIGETELAALLQQAMPSIERMREGSSGPPTFFETYTLLAFLYFAQRDVDCAVLEAGMGGRLDATNVVKPLVTAITTIALDHTTELGATLSAIAGEKAGIIKPGVPVVCAPQMSDADTVIDRVACEQQSPLYRVGRDIFVHGHRDIAQDMQCFSITGVLERYVRLACPLLGEHQQRNAAVAVGLAECLQQLGLPITPESIRTGLAQVVWPGRMQVLRRHPILLLDGAHDPAAIDVLLEALARHFPGHPCRFVLGFLHDKDWPRMLEHLAPHAVEMLFTRPKTPRAVEPDILNDSPLAAGIPRHAFASFPEAITAALAHSAADDLICVTGSLYLVGEALRWWEGQTKV